MSERQILNRIRKLQELEARRETLENEIGEIKGQIQAQMQEAEELQAGGFIIRWARVITQRLDTKALKAEYPYLWEEFSKPAESRRFTVAQAK